MGIDGSPWLASLNVVLFGALLFLRGRYPNTSKNTETGVLLTLTILFFSICGCFLGAQASRGTGTLKSADRAATLSIR